jgi:bifunctional enzyme CysN/CysC
VDGFDIAGGGIIVSAERDNQEEFREEARLRDFHWIKGGVTSQRANPTVRPPAALVMFVGKTGVGKHRYARALEKALFQGGHATYMLDGTNVLLGVDSDMIWAQSTQQELVRRFAEVAHLLLDAGLLVVSTTNAIGLGDVAAVQALIPDFPVLAVEITGEGGNLFNRHAPHRARNRTGFRPKSHRFIDPPKHPSVSNHPLFIDLGTGTL